MTDSISIQQTVNQVNVVEQKNNAIISSVGVQGPAGPQGPAGLGAANLSYVYTTTSALSTWTINHNMGYYPNVSVREYGVPDITIEGEVHHQDVNNLTITFSYALIGHAYLS
jgi:hypothetical protein